MSKHVPLELALEADKDYVIVADNIYVLPALPDEFVDLIYIDPPFNTGKAQRRITTRAVRVPEAVRVIGPPVPMETDRSSRARGGTDSEGRRCLERNSSRSGLQRTHRGFGGVSYRLEVIGEMAYPDSFDDYVGFLSPRLEEAKRLLARHGSIYVHLDYREVHYVKVELDRIFGREAFLNEIVWAYDYGGRPKKRWPAKHDTILFYAKDPRRYYFDIEAAGRIPYLAPSLAGPEKAARGKSPTDVWWHTVVSPTGKEKTGYPNQKPEGIVERVVASSSPPGGRVLDFFAGSGTTGVVARRLGRRFVLVDREPRAAEVTLERFAKTFGDIEDIEVIEFSSGGAPLGPTTQ